MNFTLTKPCTDCPFRNDKPFHLTVERAEEIAHGVTELDQTFACHKTTREGSEDDDGWSEMETTMKSQHCAGVLIMLEKMEQPNQMMRIAERIGMYDRTKLDMDAPVFNDTDEFIESMEALNA